MKKKVEKTILLLFSLFFFLLLNFSLNLVALSQNVEKNINLKENKENEEKTEVRKPKKSISNFSLVGSLGRKRITMFFTIKNDSIRGVYLFNRRHVNINLIGKKEGEEIILYEVSNNKTNATFKLTKKNNFFSGTYSSSKKYTVRLRNYSPSQNSFTYRNRPIIPRTINKILEKINTSSLAVQLKNENQRGYKLIDGWLQNNLEYGYIRYQVITNQDNLWFLNIIVNYGGSGNFSSIIKVAKINTFLILIDTVERGDRAMGGIDGVNFKDGKITYGKKLAPLGIMKTGYQIFMKESFTENPLEQRDWIDCAACVFGKILYYYDYQQDEKIPYQLLLNDDSNTMKALAGNYPNFKKQNHFNKIFLSYLNSKKTMLNLDEMKLFLKKILKK